MIALTRSIQTAKGFGGLVFIAILGLSVLVFGGILTNLQLMRQERTAVANLRLTLDSQAILKPLDQRVQEVRQGLGVGVPERPALRQAKAEMIPALREELQSLGTQAGFSVLSITPVLEDASRDNYRLRFDLRLRGDYLQLRDLLNALDSWPYAGQLEAFSVKAVPNSHEVQVLYVVPLT